MKLCRARQWGFRHIFTWAVTTCSQLAVSSQHSWGPARELVPRILKKKKKKKENQPFNALPRLGDQQQTQDFKCSRKWRCWTLCSKNFLRWVFPLCWNWAYVITPKVNVILNLSNLTNPNELPQRRDWQSTPVFLPGESHEQRRLSSYSLWDHKESDMTEPLATYSSTLAWKIPWTEEPGGL